MSELVEFLLARIVEDETVARENSFQLGGPRPWALFEGDPPISPICIDPRRVVAECDAKRRIIEEHHRSGVTCPRCSLGTEDGEVVFERDPCMTLRLLAPPYADHPDYRDEWRP